MFLQTTGIYLHNDMAVHYRRLNYFVITMLTKTTFTLFLY